MKPESEPIEIDRLEQLLRHGLRAQAAIDDLTAREPCPFCGGRDQKLIPCEVPVEQDDGTEKAEAWFAVLCACMANSAASATEAGAWRIWNARA